MQQKTMAPMMPPTMAAVLEESLLEPLIVAVPTVMELALGTLTVVLRALLAEAMAATNVVAVRLLADEPAEVAMVAAPPLPPGM